MSALSAAGQAWVDAADAAAIAQAKAKHEADLAEMSPRMRSWMVVDDDEDEDVLIPDEEWQAPYGPEIAEGVPVLLLDVDGALSPFGTPEDGMHWPAWDHHLIDVEPNRPLISVPLAQAMTAAVAALDVQIVWLTTWGEKANTHLAPLLGWDPLPVLDVTGGRRFKGEHDGWAKLHVVKRWLRTYGPRPLVWVDDDVRIEDLAQEDLYVKALKSALLLRTDRDAGITPADLDRVTTFLGGLS